HFLLPPFSSTRTAPTDIYPLSLHDALPISLSPGPWRATRPVASEPPSRQWRRDHTLDRLTARLRVPTRKRGTAKPSPELHLRERAGEGNRTPVLSLGS